MLDKVIRFVKITLERSEHINLIYFIMIKKYLKITKEQRERGVVFSSEFVGGDNPIRHEITMQEFRDNPCEAEAKEARLRDDSFFRNWGRDEGGDIIHEIRTK